jgi:hypothetical protein
VQFKLPSLHTFSTTQHLAASTILPEGNFGIGGSGVLATGQCAMYSTSSMQGSKGRILAPGPHAS